MFLVLNRVEMEEYTLGFLTVKNKVFFTLELPFINNEKNISCIPEGLYTIKKHNSPKFGSCLFLLNVPQRSEILIHSGNYVNYKKPLNIKVNLIDKLLLNKLEINKYYEVIL